VNESKEKIDMQETAHKKNKLNFIKPNLRQKLKNKVDIDKYNASIDGSEKNKYSLFTTLSSDLSRRKSIPLERKIYSRKTRKHTM
tara:strand:+ start:273 stop:527 length:255 start_codon:yes stop_codon:yes gene_type:complete